MDDSRTTARTTERTTAHTTAPTTTHLRTRPIAIALAGALSLAVAMGIGRFAFTPLLPMMLHDGVVDLGGASWLATANYLGYWIGAMACALQPALWQRRGWRPLAHTPAALMAHGEHRQLELAMALALRPRVLLLDEPLAGMSGPESATMVALLQGLRGQVPMLLVEHDMHAVFALADRISVLVYGHIIARGTPEAIRADADVRNAYLGDEELPA